MLTKTQFDILNAIYKANGASLTQRELAEETGISLGKVNQEKQELLQMHAIDEFMHLTSRGMEELEPYRVTNAVIMAAGMSSRFAPLSYEKPKALLRVKGELLIEREIEQLKAAGIRNIILVVGYMKERLFYLESKYGVKIAVNEDYYRYNNTSSLICAVNDLDNTYICSSDNYFVKNPFETFVYRSYYSAVYAEGKTDEYCISCNKKGLITSVMIGGCNSWYMIGHVYFDRSFSKIFAEILKKEYDNLLTKQQLWEDLYIRYIDKLDLYIRKYDAAIIKEFDSLEELRQFDNKYLCNADSSIFANICSVLNVKEQDISEISPIKNGLTNSSFCFICKGKKYVYRHPGVGTEKYINRKSEYKSMQTAKRLGLDQTYIYMDAVEGWKISYYIEDVSTLDYHNEAQVRQALSMLRTLHGSDEDTGHFFNIWDEIAEFEKRLKESGRNQFEDLKQIHEMIEKLHQYAKTDGVRQCLCHCDSYDPNFLIDKEGNMSLIDWEYSGMADPGCDIGTFIACSDYTDEEAKQVINIYLGYAASDKELRHFLAYVAAAACYWFLWAIYQESLGKNVGEYLYIWYRYTKQYGKEALEMFEKGDV
ncbi:MAG: phosphotransferase [Lachnospiraceae bacterium]|nr:phosphotransferase [Lachnospiraceae bacterium]